MYLERCPCCGARARMHRTGDAEHAAYWVQMRVRLCSDDAKPEGLLLKLDDFFGV